MEGSEKLQPKSWDLGKKKVESFHGRLDFIMKDLRCVATRYSKVLRTWIWMSLGVVVLDVPRKVSEFWGPYFQKILALDFRWVLTFGSDLPKMQ